jgi:hypothetical protein
LEAKAAVGGVHVYYVPADSNQIPPGNPIAEVTINERAVPQVPDTPGREVDF